MNLKQLRFAFLIVAIAVLAGACANIGNPGGGPVDMAPPIFVRSSPKPNACDVDRTRIDLYFDEIVTLEDPSNKVIVSPAQVEMPKISTNGKRVSVELIDSLQPNTTYTIDFSNAIRDNNEGNPLDNFAFAFSTGPAIDSLRVSGFVLDSRTLEPMQGVVVGLHSNLADSAFRKIKMERVSLTNDRGQFTIRNIKQGRYRLYALRDVDRNYMYSPGEDMAFLDSIVVPSVGSREVADTLYDLNNEIDTIRHSVKPDYLPNDILLNMFNENIKSQYLANNTRIDSTRIQLLFAAPSDTLPTLTLLDPPFAHNDWYTLERSAGNDTLTYWIRPRELVSDDTLNVAVRYLRTDTTSRLTWGTDTMRFTFQRPKPVKKKKRDKDDADTLPEMRFMDFRSLSGSTVEVYAPLYLQAATPVERLDTAAVHLEMQQDTLWIPAGDFSITMRDSTIDRRTFTVKTRWEPGARYRLAIDSTGVTDIYGLFTKPFVAEFSVRKMEDYGNLIFSIPAVRDSAFVELLDGSEKVVLKAPVRNSRAELINLLPGQYYARLVIDKNGNGEYDTGNYDLRIQPEDTYYYPGSINLKKNWDIEQTWDIYALPVDRQKPEAIKKNKPERNKWETEPTTTETDEDEDESGFNDFMDPNDPNQQFFNQMNGY